MKRKKINSLADLQRRKRQINRELKRCEMNIQDSYYEITHPFKNLSSSPWTSSLRDFSIEKGTVSKIMKATANVITIVNIGVIAFRKIKKMKNKEQK